MKWFALLLLAAALAFAAGPEILRVNAVSDAQILNKVTPPYPPDALDHHISGVVKMTVLIGADGHVQRVRLISGHPLLAPAAMTAVRRWVFKPFQDGDTPVRALANIEIPFTLPN